MCQTWAGKYLCCVERAGEREAGSGSGESVLGMMDHVYITCLSCHSN